jgi:hypothetical protein
LACAQSLERFVFSSFGESVNSSGITFTYSVGEPITPTYFSNPNNLILTQGFLQPEKSDNLAIENQELENENFSVFPNPSSGVYTIKVDSDKAFNYQVYNTEGKLVLGGNQLLSAGHHSVIICAEHLSQGLYYLRIIGENNQMLHHFKLIKINP